MRAGLQITRLAALSEPRMCDLRNARQTHCLCRNSRYKIQSLNLKGSFLSHCCSLIIYMYIRAVSSYSLWYLVSEVKVNVFHIWICWNVQILLSIKDASFSRKILLKLFHFKSRNSRVTWSRFKYFPLLASFAAKLIHFCTSCCSFSLHLYPILNCNSVDERR